MSWNLISGYTSCIKTNHCFTVFKKEKKTMKRELNFKHQYIKIIKALKVLVYEGENLLQCGENWIKIQKTFIFFVVYTVSIYFKRAFFQYAQENLYCISMQ